MRQYFLWSGRSGDPVFGRFSRKNPRFFFDVNFDKNQILQDNPTGLLLIRIKGKRKLQNFYIPKIFSESGSPVSDRKISNFSYDVKFRFYNPRG